MEKKWLLKWLVKLLITGSVNNSLTVFPFYMTQANGVKIFGIFVDRERRKLANAFSVNLSAVGTRLGKIIPVKVVRNIIFSQTEKLSQFVIAYCHLNPCQSSFTG